MARLPVPGNDEGTWGDILNDFLSTQHNSDGTHSLNLNDLTNVNTTGASSGQVLKFNGTAWVAGTDLSGSGDPALGGDLTGTASNAQIATGSIVDADVSATAAIAQSKINNLTADLAGKEPAVSSGTTSQYYRGDKTWQTLDKTAVGLANVDNTSDADKPVSTAVQTALNAKIATSEKGAANGVAGLDGSGKIVPGQLVSANITKLLPYSYTGNLAVSAGNFRLYNDMGTTWTVSGIRASVGVAPAGASVIIDVNKNGTSLFTTQANRPTIAAASNTSGNVTTMDVTTVAAGEYLTVDIDQVGSTTAGADLTVQIEVI